MSRQPGVWQVLALWGPWVKTLDGLAGLVVCIVTQSVAVSLASIWDLPVFCMMLEGNLGEFLTYTEMRPRARNNHLYSCSASWRGDCALLGFRKGLWGLSWRSPWAHTGQSATSKNAISGNKLQGDQKWCFTKKKYS